MRAKWRRLALPIILPLVCAWIAWQRRRILRNGIPLTDSQRADAVAVGVKFPELVRVLHVRKIPFLSRRTLGLAAAHGIFIRDDCREVRALLVHELAHTAQYERSGGITPFLREYLREFLDLGYPFGALEREAAEIAKRVCD